MKWRLDSTVSLNEHIWENISSNIILDFHGNPFTADLVIFSDGNHHMALSEVIEAFKQRQHKSFEIFYATTPPAPLVSMLKGEVLQIGNFKLDVQPHVFLSPPHVLKSLEDQDLIMPAEPFVINQGNALLVKKGNPKQIKTVNDLEKKECTLFLSNHKTEKASFDGYIETIVNLADKKHILDLVSVCFGSVIHHREAPEAIASGKADVAILYFHLAKYLSDTFPELFEMIILKGNDNVKSETHAALVRGSGSHGKTFFDFLFSEPSIEVYHKHGLIPL